PLVEHLFVLHRELAGDAVVMERARSARRDDVEARQVSASVAAIARRSHAAIVTGARVRPGGASRTYFRYEHSFAILGVRGAHFPVRADTVGLRGRADRARRRAAPTVVRRARDPS